jgi:hypothetical protein
MLLTRGNVHNDFKQCHFVLHHKSYMVPRPSTVRTASNRPENCAAGKLELPYTERLPIPLPAQSRTWVCGRTHVGITGSNPSGIMDVSLL